MTTRTALRSTVIGLLWLAGCSNKTAVDPSGGATPPAADPAPQRPSLTAAECEAKNGVVVGDIGDGAIHRPDYKCEGGQPPLGSIASAEGEPVAIEGSVCCPAAS